MVSSLEIGPRPGYGGRAVAPQGSGGAFLSVGAPAAPMGATELRDAMALAPSRVEYVSAALPPRAAVSGMGQFDVRHISEGTFTEVTIRNMHKAVLAAKTDAHWRGMMEDIRRAGRRAGAVGWKDYGGEVAWFDHWYRRVHPIDYVRDPHQVELVMHPMLVYLKSLGDCDDMSTLFTGSLGALGAPHAFRTFKADPARRPGEWTHVSAVVWVPGRGWVNEDLTVKGAHPGWEPVGFETKDWPEPRW